MTTYFNALRNLGATVLFIFLEIISLVMIIWFNQNQREIFLHSSNTYVADLKLQKAKVQQSLELKSHNDKLLVQNAKLIEELTNEKLRASVNFENIDKKYEVIPARIINSSIHTLNNYLTLDKGLKDGIDKNYGILGVDGIVGIVNQVNDDYSTGISLLNVNLRLSVKIKNKGYTGYLIWSGLEYGLFKLYGIPQHAEIEKGDEVITSGHSAIFPPDIEIGKVESHQILSEGSFFVIDVRMNTDLTKTEMVYVIKNNDFEKIKAIEDLNEN